jgi:hypothetical protein
MRYTGIAQPDTQVVSALRLSDSAVLLIGASKTARPLALRAPPPALTLGNSQGQDTPTPTPPLQRYGARPPGGYSAAERTAAQRSVVGARRSPGPAATAAATAALRASGSHVPCTAAATAAAAGAVGCVRTAGCVCARSALPRAANAPLTKHCPQWLEAGQPHPPSGPGNRRHSRSLHRRCSRSSRRPCSSSNTFGASRCQQASGAGPRPATPRRQRPSEARCRPATALLGALLTQRLARRDLFAAGVSHASGDHGRPPSGTLGHERRRARGGQQPVRRGIARRCSQHAAVPILAFARSSRRSSDSRPRGV